MINYRPLKYLEFNVERRHTVAGLQSIRSLIRDKMAERDTDFSDPYLESLADGTVTIDEESRNDSLSISLRSRDR
jgi:hypothetical protein